MNKSDVIIDKPVLVLVGPTAVGKTSLSLQLAKVFNCEIVSVDSMQVYRYMDIGTAKASEKERAVADHHLIDIVNPDEPYNADNFVHDALQSISQIHRRGHIPLLTGGTGLYLRSLLEGLFDEWNNYPQERELLQKELIEKGLKALHEELLICDHETAKRVHRNDTHRVVRALEIFRGSGKTWSEHLREHKQNKRNRFQQILLLGLTSERQALYRRINSRAEAMIKEGLREEVEWLLNEGYSPELKSMQSIGYKHMINHVVGKWTLSETIDYLARDTRRYAKRQFTWFKKMDIVWFQRGDEEKMIELASKFIS